MVSSIETGATELAMFQSLSKYSPLALGVFRTVVALLFLGQGSQKLFNFPPSMMPAQPGMETLELVTGIFEFLGGLLILVGFLTRAVSFILCGMMAVAYFMVHAPKGFFPANNMDDAAILFCFAFFYLFFAGPGRWSFDNRS